MIKLIIDAAGENIFLMLINNNNVYNITHTNSKTNYEKLMILINDLLNSKKLKIKDISAIYVNRGPGSFAGIRNSLSTIKAIHLAVKIDYYCYSFQDFKDLFIFTWFSNNWFCIISNLRLEISFSTNSKSAASVPGLGLKI